MTDTSSSLTVGFDIGGTNMRAGVVDAGGRIIDARSLPSPRDAEGMSRGIAHLVDLLRRDHEIAAVGVAVAGFLDPDCEVVRFAPHLPWRDAPVRSMLEERLGLPVKLEHDANSAAWGEYRFGAAQGVETWVLFAVGTGIGATLMTRGEIFRGAYGTAPEFGHLTVVPGGRPCPCGKLGCLERYCSGTALMDSAIELVHKRRFSGSTLAAQVRRDPNSVDGLHIMQAARRGDAAGMAVVEEFASWLGTGLSIVADILDPELILLGGGVSRDADLYLDQATEQFSSQIVGTGYRPLARVATAELGADAGMIGVADLARGLVAG
ncbi:MULTISPECIES: ROK family protein [unclassified Corynebacterium]|uniref:ROK family protein n=1 Tax=unclassified Corynebacterium TaxID=2624378 RepID=UPI0029C9B959|nr:MULTISPECIES: ROK family protein [unclassified Corynebacterium]WPF65463.1 ROK family protein [Corynebacterium sp. 22KM0430]WPF67959.1 ROK family protein [Corynebacterium sp. 21KM1197]